MQGFGLNLVGRLVEPTGMDVPRDRGRIDDHPLEALWACEPRVNYVELADYILQHFAQIPITDRAAQQHALDALTDTVRQRHDEAMKRARALQEQ